MNQSINQPINQPHYHHHDNLRLPPSISISRGAKTPPPIMTSHSATLPAKYHNTAGSRCIYTLEDNHRFIGACISPYKQTGPPLCIPTDCYHVSPHPSTAIKPPPTKPSRLNSPLGREFRSPMNEHQRLRFPDRIRPRKLHYQYQAHMRVWFRLVADRWLSG